MYPIQPAKNSSLKGIRNSLRVFCTKKPISGYAVRGKIGSVQVNLCSHVREPGRVTHARIHAFPRRLLAARFTLPVFRRFGRFREFYSREQKTILQSEFLEQANVNLFLPLFDYNLHLETSNKSEL